MSVKPLLGLVLLLAACKSEPEDTDVPPPTPCGDTIPSITDVVIFDNGVMDFADGTWPSLRLEFEAADADGALTSYTILAGYDDDIDGIVDMTDPLTATNSFGPHDCSVGAASLFMDIAVNGAPPPLTFLEIGVVLEDADGQQSDPPVILTITSPAG